MILRCCLNWSGRKISCGEQRAIRKLPLTALAYIMRKYVQKGNSLRSRPCTKLKNKGRLLQRPCPQGLRPKRWRVGIVLSDDKFIIYIWRKNQMPWVKNNDLLGNGRTSLPQGRRRKNAGLRAFCGQRYRAQRLSRHPAFHAQESGYTRGIHHSRRWGKGIPHPKVSWCGYSERYLGYARGTRWRT